MDDKLCKEFYKVSDPQGFDQVRQLAVLRLRKHSGTDLKRLAWVIGLTGLQAIITGMIPATKRIRTLLQLPVCSEAVESKRHEPAEDCNMPMPVTLLKTERANFE